MSGPPPTTLKARLDLGLLDALAGTAEPRLRIDGLQAGYGRSEILHGVDLRLAAGQSLCLVGPNGAGKSTVLNAIFGFAEINRGRILLNGIDITRTSPQTRLRDTRIAYVLQDISIFPDMTVEQNIGLGAYTMNDPGAARGAAERVFDRYPRLAKRRNEPARVLSGGERRLLEIARALIMEPRLLLIDEPSIGLEPVYVELVFDMLQDLKRRDGTAILLVEQNTRRGLAFADRGCVLVAGEVMLTGSGANLACDPSVGQLFLGH